ncbi:MAG: ISL3 family transposase [Mangrovibacterium sp.]
MKQFANKSKFSPFYALLQLPGITINEVLIEDSQLSIVAKIKAKSGLCPQCGNKSSSVHSFYCRNLQDLSVVDKQVNIKLHIRKLFCRNKRCSHKIFSQQLTSGLARYARRTSRANLQLTQMSLETSARKSSWLSKLIRIPVSPSSCLRLVNNCGLPSADQIQNIGIDDWAYRKGISYGTIFVDMDQGRVVDILPGRDGNEVKSFLQSHKEIQSVCRDRSGAYSAAVNEVIPSARQVADRFHLIKNLSDSVYQLIKAEYVHLVRPLKSRAVQSDGEPVPETETREVSSKTNESPTSIKGAPSDYRKGVFDEVKSLINQGIGFKTISRRLKISRNTVRKYATLDVPPNKSVTPKNDYLSYLPVIERELNNGNNMQAIYKIIVTHGFQGSLSAFYEQFRDHPLRSSFRKPALPREGNMQYVSVLSPRKISLFLSFDDLEKIKNEKEKQQIRQLLESNSILENLRQLVLSFRKILREGTPEQLDRWMEKVVAMKRKILNTLINGMKRDIAAIYNAILTNWSSGRVEGNVNRLKNIKRQMYGRASFELLRRKVVLSNTG